MASLQLWDSDMDGVVAGSDWAASEDEAASEAGRTASPAWSSSRPRTFKWQPRTAAQEARVKERIRQRIVKQPSHAAMNMKLMAMKSRRRAQLAIEQRRAFNRKERALVLQLAVNMHDLGMRVAEQADWAQELFSAAKTIQRAYRQRLARRQAPALHELIDPEANRPLLADANGWSGWKIKHDKWRPEGDQLRRLRTTDTGAWADYASTTDSEFADSGEYSGSDTSDRNSDEESEAEIQASSTGPGRLRPRQKRRLGVKVHQSIVKAYRVAGLEQQLKALLGRKGSANLTRRSSARPGTTAVRRPTTQLQTTRRPTAALTLKPMSFGPAAKTQTLDMGAVATLARGKSRARQALRTTRTGLHSKISNAAALDSDAQRAKTDSAGAGLSLPTKPIGLSILLAVQRTEAATSVGADGQAPDDQTDLSRVPLLPVGSPGKLTARLNGLSERAGSVSRSDDPQAMASGPGPNHRPAVCSDSVSTGVSSATGEGPMPLPEASFGMLEDGRACPEALGRLDESGSMGDIDWSTATACAMDSQAEISLQPSERVACSEGQGGAQSSDGHMQPAARRVILAQRFFRATAACVTGASSEPGGSVPAYVVLAPEAPATPENAQGHEAFDDWGQEGHGWRTAEMLPDNGQPERSRTGHRDASAMVAQLPRGPSLSPVPEWEAPPASQPAAGSAMDAMMDLINDASEEIVGYVSDQLADLQASLHPIGSLGSHSSAADLLRPRLVALSQYTSNAKTEGSLKNLTRRIMNARRFVKASMSSSCHQRQYEAKSEMNVKPQAATDYQEESWLPSIKSSRSTGLLESPPFMAPRSAGTDGPHGRRRWSQPSRLPPPGPGHGSAEASGRRQSDSDPPPMAQPQAQQRTRHSGSLAPLPATTPIKKNRLGHPGAREAYLRASLPPATMAQMGREAATALPAVPLSSSFTSGMSPSARLLPAQEGTGGLVAGRADSAYDLMSELRQAGHGEALAAELLEKGSWDHRLLPSDLSKGRPSYYCIGSRHSTADGAALFDVSGLPAPWTPHRSRQSSQA